MSIYDTQMTRNDLLDKVKQQYEPGPMRPRLCEIFAYYGQPIEPMRYAWEYYAGMGDTDLANIDRNNDGLIETLKNEGYLVPTGERDFYNVTKLRYLQHFDDVNWGSKPDGTLVMYNLYQGPISGIPDLVLPVEARHDAAVALLERRISYGSVLKDDPITLHDGTTLIPIVTDQRVIAMRQRQKGIVPKMA